MVVERIFSQIFVSCKEFYCSLSCVLVRRNYFSMNELVLNTVVLWDVDREPTVRDDDDNEIVKTNGLSFTELAFKQKLHE